MAAETIDVSQSVLHVNMSNITKLTSTNYLTWKVQVHSLLDGYDLAGFLDGSKPAPAQSTTTNDQVTPNPAYATWRRQDKLIYSGLLGTLCSSIQPLVSSTTSSQSMWKTIASTYASPSWGHIQQLRIQLKQATKGDKSIDDYVQGFLIRFEKLALLGKPVDHQETLEYILEGLPEEYKSVVDPIEGRETPPSISEIVEKLLNREAKLLAAFYSVSKPVPISANVASGPQPYQGKHHPRQQQHWNNNNNNHHSSSRQDYRGARGYQGKCQLCGVFGHSAKRCPQFHMNQSGSSNALLPSPFRPWQPRANLALAPPQSSDPWIMDSGATHHMTSDLHNLSLHHPYQGGDSVTVGDGSALSIKHTGSLSLPSTSRPLTLKNVLCVPKIHKNLISVYRLCNANNVTVEFAPAHLQVKDLKSGVPLLQGKARAELYEWPTYPSPISSFFASSSTKPSMAD
ncbi:PREDICTED: uncharacterized protein LOC104789470 [Camelina sativa]|uniref:Uncharacterized protein LOC104789470 n=1 Tax=Camelina sativa TaxID=90675 RepID=A0ABM0ZBV9_CAMSA|nr:PREDICTED: uncharacterized protein LOC104789470 [Camelina sativa]